MTNTLDARLSRLLDGTNRSVLPRGVADLVTQWLHAGAVEARTSPGPAPPASVSARLVLDARGVSEETVVLHTGRGARVGVTCEPITPASTDTWLVFLNAARVRRVGPNRLWTTYARDWASRGLCSLRLAQSLA